MFFQGRDCQLVALKSSTENSLKGVHFRMYSVRPLPWLKPRFHDVMRLCRFGYMALQIGVNHVATKWGSGPPDETTYERLIPHCDFPMLDKAGELPMGSFVLAFGFDVPYLEPSVVPAPMLRKQDLVKWWEELLRPDDMTKEAFSAVMSQPEYLISFGYQMLRGPYHFSPECSREYGACLSMVGAGTVALVCSRICTLCKFRRAFHASDRCDLCSMSKFAINLEQFGQQAATTRKRKRVQRAGNSTLGELLVPHLDEPAERALASMVESMNPHSSEYKAWAKKIRDSLSVAPDIVSQLPEDFQRLCQQEQLIVLRRVIDPQEFDYAVWPAKILAAQRWMDAEAKIASRRKVSGPTQGTTERAEHARSLLRTGLTRTETATQMGISLSNLSHILRRTQRLRVG